MSKNTDNVDRLDRLEEQLKKKERKGTRLCWIKWNPNSRFGYDIDDAREDVRWMVYEIQKLREENAKLREFVDNFRNAMEENLKD